jgi:uncharacterized protein YbaR (Trm112 family)
MLMTLIASPQCRKVLFCLEKKRKKKEEKDIYAFWISLFKEIEGIH